MSTDVRTNALDDLLDAERHFRSQAENALRELQSVLTELAQRVAGSQIEDIRRTDPTAPEYWEPGRWRKFLAGLPVQVGSNGWNDNLLVEVERLKAENQALTNKLESLSSSIAPSPESSNLTSSSEIPTIDPVPGPIDPDTLPKPDSDPTLQEIVSHSRSIAHPDLLRELRALIIPTTLPARFQNHFPKFGLNVGDWERQVRRKLYVLFLLGQGLDIRLEIDHLISQVEGIGSRTGALRRIYDSLVEKKLIEREVLEMSAPNTSLAMLQLTQEGRELCGILHWEVSESERQRLIRLHQGEQFPQHTLAILIFAMHARLRAYRVEVLPELTGVQTKSIPDVSVFRRSSDPKDDPVYVEVELSKKELDPKWRNLAELQGSVALCARNIQHRTRLVGDCKLKNLHGCATDLETLIACKVPDISGDSPLWAEEW
jgi:hypothetical protein